jgi:hypothetical protein
MSITRPGRVALRTASLTQYKGRLLNHVEVLYPRGGRDLAVALFELLDCTVVSREGSTYTLVFPEASEQDRNNNVLYLSEVRDLQLELERVIEHRIGIDAELREAIERYDMKARTHPHGIPHFGLRYPSFDDLESVLYRLANDLPKELKGRVTVETIRPDDRRSMSPDLIQAFLRTDVVCVGLFPFGQLIELQGQRAVSEPKANR